MDQWAQYEVPQYKNVKILNVYKMRPVNVN